MSDPANGAGGGNTPDYASSIAKAREELDSLLDERAAISGWGKKKKLEKLAPQIELAEKKLQRELGREARDKAARQKELDDAGARAPSFRASREALETQS